MRHLVKGKKLGRTKSHRAATLSALSVALIKEHRIVTTLAKAKALRPYVEPLITKAKKDTTHNRRQVFSKLKDKQAVTHLFEEVAKKAMDRPGGYTRVIKMGLRSGDSAKMAVIELVDYNDIKPEDSQKKKRTRRAGKSNTPTSTEKAEEEAKKAESKEESDDKKTEESAEAEVAEEQEETQEENVAEADEGEAEDDEEAESESEETDKK